MTTATARMLDIRRQALRNFPPQEPGRADEQKGTESFPTAEANPAENLQSITQELDAVRREQAILQQAVYEAAQIQRKLCAPRELIWGEFEIAGEIFPVRHLSGDFFKVMPLDSVLGLVLGDIAGKGLSAGIWQAHMMSSIQRCARTFSDPADAVAEVNRELCQDHDEPPLTALFFGRLDPQRNELIYCNAGLPAPLLLRHNQSVERLEKGGPMLGALQQAAFDSGAIRLDPGDMLLAYSDGVTECRNSQEEEFDMPRLVAAAKSVSRATANQALFSILATVLDFADACSPGDDLSLLVVRRGDSALKEPPGRASKGFSAPRPRPASLKPAKKSDRRGNGPK